MKGRITRPEQGVQLELPEIGRLHIGMKANMAKNIQRRLIISYHPANTRKCL